MVEISGTEVLDIGTPVVDIILDTHLESSWNITYYKLNFLSYIRIKWTILKHKWSRFQHKLTSQIVSISCNQSTNEFQKVRTKLYNMGRIFSFIIST